MPPGPSASTISMTLTLVLTRSRAPSTIGANSVSVLLGRGDGTFRTKTDYGVGGTPFSVAIGDLNGDGKLDLAVANGGSASVSILIGRGDGTFGAGTEYPAGTKPFSVAIGDLDEDSKPDLVTANYGANAVSVLLGNGDGTFPTRTEYGVGSNPYSVAIGDLNEDGRPDLVVANSNSNSVSVLTGNGHGSFGGRRDFATGVGPFSVVIGDLDGDGKPDLATANHDASSLSVLFGNGDGTFGANTDYAAGGSPYSVAIGDLDRNGSPDVATANSGSSSVSVLLSNGDGTFAAKTDYGTNFEPHSVSFGDLNGDGMLDIAAANWSSSTVSVLLNVLPRPGVPTSMLLTSDVNPSVFGQPVTLTAAAAPSTTTGTVQFLDNGVVFGVAVLNAGLATFSVSNLLHREHWLTARHVGNADFAQSESPVLIQVVAIAGTTTGIAASVNPSIQRQSVNFVATTATTPPGAGVPAGTAQFRVDGVEFGSPVGLSNGFAASAFTDTLSPGQHDVEAIFIPENSLRFAASTSSTLHQAVEASNPAIVAVRDVPNDQGGRVFVNWHCVLDKPGVQKVTGYRVWRRVPGLVSAQPSNPTRVLGAASVAGTLAETFWEAIANLPAAQLVSYGYTAATTQDSLPGSNPYTAYFVQALTADPFVWYDSAPDSGYSVDNLAPPTPTPFVAQYGPGGAVLHWLPNPAADFREFRLHRGNSPEFVPGPGNVVFAGRDTGYVDRGSPGGYYKLAAVDVHGNASKYAMVSPTNPTATLASLVSAEWTGTAASMSWFGDGLQGLHVNLYRCESGGDWVLTAQLAADGEGYLRYADTAVHPGHRYSYRLGILDGSGEQFAGETSISVPEGRLAIRVVDSNPVRGDAITFAAALAGTGPATVRVLDLAGRSVREQPVHEDLSGSISISLGGGRPLSPGVYLLELRQAGQRAVTRFVYLR